jgi:hypothetical protein
VVEVVETLAWIRTRGKDHERERENGLRYFYFWWEWIRMREREDSLRLHKFFTPSNILAPALERACAFQF